MSLNFLRSSLGLSLLFCLGIGTANAQVSATYSETDGIDDLQFYRGEKIIFTITRTGDYKILADDGDGEGRGEYFQTVVNTGSSISQEPGVYKKRIGHTYQTTETIEVFDSLDGIWSDESVVITHDVWTDSFTYTILERPLATISLTSSRDAEGMACDGVPLTFTANVTGAGIADAGAGFPNGPTYDWYKGGNLVVAGTTSNTYTTTINDMEEVQAVLHPGFKANPTIVTSEPLALTILIEQNPVVDIITPTLCYLQPATFSADLSGLNGTTTYQWKRGGTAIEGATDATWTTSDISKYNTEDISLVVTNTMLGCTGSSEAEVSVIAATTLDPNVLVTTASGSTKLCEGDPVTFTSKSAAVAGATFSWAIDGNVQAETGSSFTTSQAGVVTATVSSAQGCTRSASRTINALPPATATAQGSTAICPGASLTLKADAVDGATYRWKQDAASRGAAQTQIAKTAGSYAVTVTKNGCSATSEPINVSIKTPDLSVTPLGATSVCSPDSVTLTAVPHADYSYTWYKSNTAVGNDNSYTAGVSGTYYLGIAYDGCPEKKSAAIPVMVTATPAAAIGRLTRQPAYWVLRASPGTSGHTYQWYKDGEIIEDSTRRDLVVSANGNYTVMVTKGSCSATSADYAVSSATFPVPEARMVAGITEVALINIFPNPSTGVFNIGSEEPVNVVVRDVQGRMVAEATNTSSIDLTKQPTGMYIMSITDGEGKLLQVARVVKQ